MTTRDKRPTISATHDGELHLGQHITLDCYVLDSGARVMTLGSAVKSLTGTSGSDLASYISVQALRPYLDPDKALAGAVEFTIPRTQFIGRGIEAETFVNICTAYVEALADGASLTERQQEIAQKASVLLAACAKVGLIALIDEATGYQYKRRADALQMKLRAFLRDELRPWEKTFPDELWIEFGRLTGWEEPLRFRPKYWGIYVMEMIYEALDPDVAEVLREERPEPRHGQNYHQWMSDNFGLPELTNQINQVIGIAKTCSSIGELRRKVRTYYGREVQMELVPEY